MELTPQKAKELSLEIWEFMATNPGVKRKNDLPSNILDKVHMYHSICPLCELYVQENLNCPDCPLKKCSAPSVFDGWAYAENDNTRKKYATIIVETLKAWEPK